MKKNYFKAKLAEVENQDNEHSKKYDELQMQYNELQTELEKSEKLRHESNEICSVLSTRLEELAIFLDSLLKQKSVLGFLGIQRNKRLREVIDNSLDLSRSFTMSMMADPDKSLAQLSNITALLNGSVFQELSLDYVQEEDDAHAVLSIIPSNVTLTYQSHLYKQNKDSEPNNKQVILALREQVVNLKSELQLRDNELSKLNPGIKEVSDKMTDTGDESPSKTHLSLKDISKLFTTPTKSNTTSTTLKYHSDCQSESDAWSEPDRVVSRARIGLSHTLSNNSKKNPEKVNESTEEESNSSLTPSKRCGEKRLSIIELQQQISKLEIEVENKTVELINADTRYLEQTRKNLEQVEDLEIKLAEAKDKLVKAEAKRADAENSARALQEIVDDLRNIKTNLEVSMVEKDKETQNRINRIEIEKQEAEQRADAFEKQAAADKVDVEKAKAEVEAAQIKFAEIQEKMNTLESHLRKEYEQHTIVKLKDAEEEFLRKLRKVEENSELKINKIKEEYHKDYVKKIEVEKKLAEVDKLVTELHDLKKIVKSYEETIDSYKKKDTEVRDKLQDYQERIQVLRMELDNTTLQYSEAVLEKTKLTNEKALSEQEIGKISVKETELRRQFNEIQSEFANVSENYQLQLTTLQKQKSKLEVRMSELESLNAELHNKLVRLQTNRCDFNNSMPNIGSRHIHVIPFSRQYSDQNYSSEENMEERGNFSFNRRFIPNLQPADTERHEANSSPDLGIESDHGRFSSLETRKYS
ncbi:hypothetical protein NQ317_017119 [Molorchus minor]|uniref:Uncharacterized protein n=1 Tax=Molorchus minor TaxID=1323400 RepID=A0ABQ9JHY9_9CUCU|nr:hypothetical protein NQ317_017119 [Molorchus minor]